MVSLILLGVFVFGFLIGLKRGGMQQLIHLAGFLLSYVITFIFYRPFADYLTLLIPFPELAQTDWAIFSEAGAIEAAFYRAIAFALLFFGIKILLQILLSMTNIVTRLPVIRSFNKLTGAILGFVEFYFIAFVILYILALTPVSSIQALIEESFIANLMIKYTPILTQIARAMLF